MIKAYVGIDPGLTGAVACVDCEGSVQIWDTPTLKFEKRTGVKVGHRTEYDVPAMVDLLVKIRKAFWTLDVLNDPVAIVIEKQQAMPKDMRGTIGAFSSGWGFGLWVGVMTALGMRHEPIRPTEWKPVLMKGLPKEKDASRMRACQIFPKAVELLDRKKDHGRAEALLLAEWGRRLYAPTGSY